MNKESHILNLEQITQSQQKNVIRKVKSYKIITEPKPLKMSSSYVIQLF